MDKIMHQTTKPLTLLKSLVVSYIITAFILLLLSFLMLKADLPGIVLSGGIYLSYIVSVFLGGFLTGKRLEQKKFLWGLLLGVIYFAILLLISLLMNEVAPLPMGSYFTVFLVCAVGGMLGGMIS